MPSPNRGGLLLPPLHLQGSYVQQINILFAEPVQHSDQIVFHKCPSFRAAAHQDGLSVSTPYGNSIAAAHVE